MPYKSSVLGIPIKKVSVNKKMFQIIVTKYYRFNEIGSYIMSFEGFIRMYAKRGSL